MSTLRAFIHKIHAKTACEAGNAIRLQVTWDGLFPQSRFNGCYKKSFTSTLDASEQMTYWAALLVLGKNGTRLGFLTSDTSPNPKAPTYIAVNIEMQIQNTLRCPNWTERVRTPLWNNQANMVLLCHPHKSKGTHMQGIRAALRTIYSRGKEEITYNHSFFIPLCLLWHLECPWTVQWLLQRKASRTWLSRAAWVQLYAEYPRYAGCENRIPIEQQQPCNMSNKMSASIVQPSLLKKPQDNNLLMLCYQGPIH